jgi:raffinose/stachyose/melibiose transport system permease protein
MRRKRIMYNTVMISSVSVLLLIYMMPLVLTLNNSFKTLFEIIDNAFTLPTYLNLENYMVAFDRMNFPRAFLNTFIVTSASVFIIVVFTSMTAHFFLRNKWTINRIIFSLMIGAMIIPFQAIMIPLVSIYGSMGLLNNKATLVFLYLGFGTPLATFIYHGFMKSIPLELEEAARIDGCNIFQNFFIIVFPLLKPVTASILILNVLWIWNDYLLPFLVLMRPHQRTLPLATFSFYGTHSANYGLLLAALVMTVIPVIVMYVFLQKYIHAGIIQGAIK